MKKLLLALLLIPVISQAQQNVVSAERVFPKVDKGAEFEKALAAHAQKYHTGTWKWRVFEITSGPDYGGYHITEGPASWEEIEKRGDLGAQHTADWNKNIAPLLSQQATHAYSVYRDDLSNVALTDYSDWINIQRLTPKMGYLGDLSDFIGTMKKMWVQDNIAMAVYTTSSSGPFSYVLVTRYKNGLKERNTDFRAPIKDRYEKANGKDSWQKFLHAQRNFVESSTSELLKFRADLSSK